MDCQKISVQLSLCRRMHVFNDCASFSPSSRCNAIDHFSLEDEHFNIPAWDNCALHLPLIFAAVRAAAHGIRPFALVVSFLFFASRRDSGSLLLQHRVDGWYLRWCFRLIGTSTKKLKETVIASRFLPRHLKASRLRGLPD